MQAAVHEIQIDKIKVGQRFRKDLGDVKALATSIEQVGLLHPIVLDENDNLIAGERRIAAYRLLGEDSIPFTRISLDELVHGEFAENVIRKDFTPSEAVAIWDVIGETKSRGRPENNGAKVAPFPPGKARTIAAKYSGYSHGSLDKAKTVIQAAENNPEAKTILERMDDKKLTIQEAYNKVQRLTKRQLHAAEPSRHLPDGITLFEGDFRQTTDQISNNSIDLIFTDPPYSADYLPLYKDLGALASRVLKEGGSLVTYLGQHTIPEVLQYMQEAGLKYWWILAVKHTGASASVYGRQVFVGWKPLLWFVKGSKLQTGEFMSDYIESKPPEKALHEWEQSTVEAEHVIHQLTYENGIVLDPFMGSGTTGAGALKLNRQFIGCEIDAEKFNLAKIRLGQLRES